MTILFYNLATKNKIVLFRVLPHSIYLTQPLNIGVFWPFKHYHTDAIDKAIWLRDKKFGKLEFLAAFQLCRNQIFRLTTICHIFKSTGLVFFHPNVVFDKTCDKQAQRAETAL